MTIREFVKKSFEYDHYRKHGIWGKYTVYHIWNKEWEGAKIGFPHDRQQLADYLQVDRSALSAELSKMKADGLIDYWKNHFRLLHLD